MPHRGCIKQSALSWLTRGNMPEPVKQRVAGKARLAIATGVWRRHRARCRCWRPPASDGPGACLRLCVVGDARKPPPQLGHGRQFAPLLEGGADRGGIGLGDDEHDQSIGRTQLGWQTRRGPLRARCSAAGFWQQARSRWPCGRCRACVRPRFAAPDGLQPSLGRHGTGTGPVNPPGRRMRHGLPRLKEDADHVAGPMPALAPVDTDGRQVQAQCRRAWAGRTPCRPQPGRQPEGCKRVALNRGACEVRAASASRRPLRVRRPAAWPWPGWGRPATRPARSRASRTAPCPWPGPTAPPASTPPP